jgi:surface polysaccharide O-acyltransferase-like enzyme
MRRYGLDWLRIFVVFLLFPFHTARVFDGWEPNYIKDVQNGFSTWFDISVGYWFMALLFVIAGYSAYSALQKRTVKEYSSERVKRLLIPFLFGLVLIVPIQGYVAVLQKGLFTGSYIEYLGRFFTDFSDLSGYFGSFTPAHLWFILFLYTISMCLLPLLIRLKNKESKISDGWLLIPAFVVMSICEAVPSIGGKNIVFDAMLFLYGFLIARSKTAMDTIRRFRFVMLAGALVISPLYLILAYNLSWPSDYSLLSIGIALLRNLSVWLIILAALGLADAYLNKPSKALAYMNRASFPIYVLHQSVMMVIAYFVAATDLSPAVKFLAIMLGTLSACAVLYEAFRRIPLIRFMMGIKK